MYNNGYESISKSISKNSKWFKGKAMANPLKDYSKTKYTGIYKSKDKHIIKGFKYFLWLKINGKIKSKVLGYSIKDNLSDRSAYIKSENIRVKIERGYDVNKNINLNKLKDLYFENQPITRWNKNKARNYDIYIKDNIGSMRIESIREIHIQRIITSLNQKGFKPRTQKTILEILKPMFILAMKNKIINDNPCLYINIKIPNQKKIVINASSLLINLYQAIRTIFKNEPFYQAFFLFAFSGRRKSEITNLKWENIDLINNYYWIEDTKNKENQQYELHKYIKSLILEIPSNRDGLVFESPITKKAIINTDRQIKRIKDYMDNPKITIHYMRNILVSALSEKGTPATIMSGILGHKNINTINKYLSQNYRSSSQQGIQIVDEILQIK